MDKTSPETDTRKWFNRDEGKKVQVEEQLTGEERSQDLRPLLPATDLIEYRIPTVKYPPAPSKPKLYTKERDLVLLRRAALDNRYDKKLEPRWEGPFRLSNLTHHGRSGRLYELITGRLFKTKLAGLKDRIHLDDLRVYVSRKRSRDAEVSSVGSVKCETSD